MMSGHQQTMIQLNKIIRKAFECMRADELIAQNLDLSIKGLIELRKTYIDDPTVVAQIDVLMEEIKLKRGDSVKKLKTNDISHDVGNDNSNNNGNSNGNRNSNGKRKG